MDASESLHGNPTPPCLAAKTLGCPRRFAGACSRDRDQLVHRLLLPPTRRRDSMVCPATRTKTRLL
jgi:hypothetical protein